MRVKLTTLFLIIFLNFSNGSVIAQSDIKYESVNPPDGLSYLFKRINERIIMFLSFSDESKIQNYQKLVEVRLAELKFIIEKKDAAYFEQSTQRYFTTAGQLTDFLTSKNKKNKFEQVKNEFSSQIPVLEKLRDNFDSSTAEWRFVEDDINYIKGYTSNLSAQ